MRLSKILLLYLLSITNTYALEEQGLRTDKCASGGSFDCGKILVGAARVDQNAIQWVGNQLGSIRVSIESFNYGITGDKLYRAKKSENPNKWIFEATALAYISEASKTSSPSIGFFFAPRKAGKLSQNISYLLGTVLEPIRKILKGEGVLDGNSNGIIDEGELFDETAIKLAVTTKQGYKLESGSCGWGCSEIIIPVGGTIDFIVNANVINDDFLRNKGLEPSLHRHVSTSILINESNAVCPNSVIETSERPKINDITKYYDFISSGDPSVMAGGCSRIYDYLISANQDFPTLTTTNKNDLEGGYIDYIFYVEGHYDISNPQQWAGVSYHTYRVRTSKDATPPQPDDPKLNDVSLNISIIGNGSGTVNSSPTGINCSSNSIGNCEANFSKNSSVRLITNSTDQVEWSSSCSNGKVNLSDTSKNCTVTFTTTQKDNNSPVAVISDINPTSGTTPFTVRLDGSNSYDPDGNDISYVWSSGDKTVAGNQASMTFTEAGIHTITLTVTDDKYISNTNPAIVSITVLDSTKDSEPPIARFETRYDIPIDNNALQQSIILDPKTSSDEDGTITKYEWSITNLCDNNNFVKKLPESVKDGEKFKTTLENGKYLINLTVTDNTDQKGATSQIVTVPPLWADFTVKFVGLRTIELDASDSMSPIEEQGCNPVLTESRNITDYSWWLNDSSDRLDIENNLSIPLNPIILPDSLYENGEHIITLVIADDNGQMASSSKVITTLERQLNLFGKLNASEALKSIAEQSTSSSAIFRGGVFVNDEFLTEDKFDGKNEVTIVATVDVDKKHFEKSIEPLAMAMLGPNSTSTYDKSYAQSWYIKTKDSDIFEPWYNNTCLNSLSTCTKSAEGKIIACEEKINTGKFDPCNDLPIINDSLRSLMPFEDAKQVEKLEIDIYNGNIYKAFNKVAHPVKSDFSEIKIWIGYRVIDDNVIVYSPTPITFGPK